MCLTHPISTSPLVTTPIHLRRLARRFDDDDFTGLGFFPEGLTPVLSSISISLFSCGSVLQLTAWFWFPVLPTLDRCPFPRSHFLKQLAGVIKSGNSMTRFKTGAFRPGLPVQRASVLHRKREIETVRVDNETIQRHVDIAFDRVCVLKMESLVLKELAWSLNSVVPHTYIPRLLTLLGFQGEEFSRLLGRSHVYALSILYDVNFVRWAPSVVVRKPNHRDTDGRKTSSPPPPPP